MVEQIEEASKDLNPKITTLVVKREDVAETGREDRPRHGDVLPNTPTTPGGARRTPRQARHPHAPLPDQLSDLIGDLIKQKIR